MISIVHQGDHRYDVYHSGHDIGCISVSTNPYHNRHCYLDLGLTQFDPAAIALKSLFRTSSDDAYDTYILEHNEPQKSIL